MTSASGTITRDGAARNFNLYSSYPGQGQQVIPQSQLYGDPACNIDNIFISNSLPVGGTVANILRAG